MLNVLLALAIIVAVMAAYYFGVVRMLVYPDSAFHRLRRRRATARQARRESADLDREYASLLDEHRHIP